MSSDGVGVKIERVNLEVDPIEHKSFPKESIDPKLYVALVEQPQDAASKNQCHECIRALDAMFDIRSWKEVKLLPDILRYMLGHPWPRSLHEDQEYIAEQIKEYGRPNKPLSRRFFDMYAANPQCSRNECYDSVSNHRSAN
jgi:hypothetical protein